MISVFNPATVSAVDMSAGVYTWYAWWDFPEDRYEKVTTDPGIVYGPTFSINFTEKLSFTFLFLYGNFNADARNYSDSVLYGGPVSYYTYDIDRFDGDTALNYKLNSYFRIYLGAKYSGFAYDIKASTYTGEFDHRTFGPGAGLSVTLPVSDNFFITGNAGSFYLWGDEEYSDTNGYTSNLDVKDYGFNASISLAYYIEPASTSISIGGRYQYIKTEYEDGFSNKSKFYGITLSAAYLFSI